MCRDVPVVRNQDWRESRFSLQNVWFSDKAHLSLSSHANSKSSIFWGSQAPDEVLQRPLHSVKCTAWVAISKHGIIGLFWFENDLGETMTVNKERYIVILNNFWRTLSARCGVHQEEQWFKQDGATPIPLTSLWNGLIVALQADWSANVAFQNGHRIHQIWIHCISIFGAFQKTMCTRTIQKQLQNSK